MAPKDGRPSHGAHQPGQSGRMESLKSQDPREDVTRRASSHQAKEGRYKRGPVHGCSGGARKCEGRRASRG